MRSKRSFGLAVVVLSLVGPGTVASLAEAPDGAPGPVVLELFTAQGCSSCPAADEVLSRLGLDEKTRAFVVPLAFHVDYWNQVGWTDPFGAPAWSRRQDVYCRALGEEGGAYTPQLVVNGLKHLNGSQGQRALAEISTELQRPRLARVTLEARPSEGGKAALLVDVAAELTGEVPARKLELLVALYENGLVTPVARGENGGRTLHNDFVVRRLERAFSIEPKAGTRKQSLVTLKLDRDWKAGQLGVAAFLQDPGSMRIYAAAALPPAAALEPGS